MQSHSYRGVACVAVARVRPTHTLVRAPLEGCAVSAPRSPSLWGAFIMSVTLLLAFGARHALAVVRVQIGEAEGAPGNDVVIGVVLTADAGESVAAVENDIVFDPISTPVAIEANGRPDCTVNAAINKEATRFGFRPPGCDPTGGGCSAVHAVVIAIDNVTPIASGALLYTCSFHIFEDAAPGPYALSNINVLYAPPPGGNIEGVGVAGHITVLSPLSPTPTPTLTLTPTPTPTPTPTLTPTQPIATPTGTPGDVDCDGKLTEADVETTVEAVFDDTTACDPDCNRDGRVTAADIARVAAQFGSSH
jgi:hypothetical protein